MLSARKKLEERLLQTQQILGHYHNLGEEFGQLVSQYQEILSEIENKKWALKELSKTSTQLWDEYNVCVCACKMYYLVIVCVHFFIQN